VTGPQAGLRAVASGVLALTLAATAAGAQVWEVDDRLFELDVAQLEARFGAAVAMGDFDGDLWPDLAIGVPDWDQPAAPLAGGTDAVVDTGRVEVYHNLGGRGFELVKTFLGSLVGDRAGSALAMGDFDGDNKAELAIAYPGRTVDGHGAAGQVRVYDYDHGAFATAAILDQGDVPNDAPGDSDGFGHALAVGDFDNDGYQDLAVGVPYEDSIISNGGAVHLFFGSAGGLLVAGSQTWKPGLAPTLGDENADDNFGWVLASGDFNGDDYDDLAIGTPGRDVFTTHNGVVYVIRGYGSGLDHHSQQILDRSDFGGGYSAENERFGHAVAVGNFNQSTAICFIVNCYDDLAIGAPWHEVSVMMQGDQIAAGEVTVALGGSTGIVTGSGTYLTQHQVEGETPDDYDLFGYTLAAGRLDRPTSLSSTGFIDLVVASPWNDGNTGAIHLFFGSGSGIDGDKQEQTVYQQDGFGIGPAEAFDRWGLVLVVADLDRDGWGDLVVGLPDKDRGGEEDSGAVAILWGGLFADGFDSFGMNGWSNF